ncbi:hypothetical protein F4604DRAFT_1683838 [Suillus subluteus]|nr:hypothetical protein F4604DRAFT_1683838 [Suillus subluteus]
MSLGPTAATADCRNLKQGTQPRKANRNCTRRYCKQCCEVAGGCRVHRVASVSSPVAAQQHIIPPLSTIDPTSTQLDHPPVTTTQSLPAASRTANYAQNYVLSHQRTLVAEQRFQADQSLSIMIHNMIDVVLWLKRVLSLSRTTAAVQSPSKRSFSAMGMHLSRLDGITSPLKRQRNTSTNNPASPVLVSLQSPTPLPLTKSPSPTMMSPLSLTTGDSGHVTCAQARFPWKYACDMVPRIQLFVDLSDDQMIQTLFATTFPNCTYTKATFYKHRAAYRAAIKNSGNKVECAVNAGYSPAGQWNTLLAEIKANTASLTGSNGLGSVSNSDVKCHTLPPSSLPVDPSVTDTGFQLPTDLTGEMSDALASLFQNIDDMHHDTAATTNSDLPDLTSYPQIDPFSAWLNDTSHVDYSFIRPDDQTLPSLPPF